MVGQGGKNEVGKTSNIGLPEIQVDRGNEVGKRKDNEEEGHD